MTDMSSLSPAQQADLYRQAAAEAAYYGRANDALGHHYRTLAETLNRMADNLEFGLESNPGAQSEAKWKPKIGPSKRRETRILDYIPSRDA